MASIEERRDDEAKDAALTYDLIAAGENAQIDVVSVDSNTDLLRNGPRLSFLGILEGKSDGPERLEKSAYLKPESLISRQEASTNERA